MLSIVLPRQTGSKEGVEAESKHLPDIFQVRSELPRLCSG